MMRPYVKVLSLLLSIVLLGAVPAARAQDAKGAGPETLTNDSVVMMTRAGLSPNIIVNQIRASKTAFDLSTAELMRLKREKVSDAVVEAMQEAAAGPKAAPREGAAGAHGNGAAAAPPGGVAPPDEPGIYLIESAEGKSRLVQLEPSVYSQSKAGGFFGSAMTYGIKKAKVKAVISVANARLQINDRRPVFYFYFEHRGSGLSGYGGGLFGPTTSPNEFVLLKMEVKKNTREVVIMEASMWGTQSGTMDKYAQPFDYERVSPGVFKVTPRADLPPGEYCFAYGAQIAAGVSKVFDFGIRATN